MRIKHIYINKEKEPMAIPINDDGTWSEGYLPFEDRDLVMPLLVVETNTRISAKAIQLLIRNIKPDTLIPVDLEVEVVEQTREIGEEKWNDGNYDNTIFKYHRKVLRIKP